jgi:hypothetical protein
MQARVVAEGDFVTRKENRRSLASLGMTNKERVAVGEGPLLKDRVVVKGKVVLGCTKTPPFSCASNWPSL